MEASNASSGSQVTPAHDRTERHYKFQEPYDACSGLCQHDRPRTVPEGRQDHRRGRRDIGPRDDVARPELVDDAAARTQPVDSLDLHADAARPVILSGRTGRAAGGRVQLRRWRPETYTNPKRQ